ncbi:MAG: hypothetical protein ACSHWY_01550 [Octadecabacter sp.]
MKKLATLATVVALAASPVLAQDMFAVMDETVTNASAITIQPFTATADGYVAVYDYHAGQVGVLLGVASVSEGANTETRIQLGRVLDHDLIALLFNGEIGDPSTAVDSVEIDVKN